jgi:hypothetical protein
MLSAMISTKRGVIIGLVIGSLIGGAGGATILTASAHNEPAAQLHAPTGQVHATADHDSSSAT